MAHLHNRHHGDQSFLSNIGNKVQHVAKIAGAVKGIYDVGKLIYNGAQAIAPIVTTAGMLI